MTTKSKLVSRTIADRNRNGRGGIKFFDCLTDKGNDLVQNSPFITVGGLTYRQIFLGNYDTFEQFAGMVGELVPGGYALARKDLQAFRNALKSENPILEQAFNRREKSGKFSPPDIAQFAYSVAGESVDVGRYLSGEPECMLDYNDYRPTEFLTIYLRGAKSGNDERYFGMILEIIDYLEQNGTRCKLVAEINHYSQEYNTAIMGRFTIKEAHEPINIRLFSNLFLSGALSMLSYSLCSSLLGVDGTAGIDFLFESDHKAIPPQKEEPNTVTFPSQRFHEYSSRRYTLDPVSYLTELGISDIIRATY